MPRNAFWGLKTEKCQSGNSIGAEGKGKDGKKGRKEGRGMPRNPTGKMDEFGGKE
jgi:hypothetical protein